MLKIGVLVSGGGTNLQSIIDRIEDGYICNSQIVTVVSSNENAYALERAKKYNIPSKVISKKSFINEQLYDNVLIEHFCLYKVDLIVLAGFLSLLGEKFVRKYENKIINIHPSLIPSFSGKGFYGIVPHKKALEYGVKVTGATVHFVDLEFDTGPIILQRSVEVKDNDTPEILQKRVMEEVEWKILPEAIKLYAEDKIEINGRRVSVKNN